MDKTPTTSSSHTPSPPKTQSVPRSFLLGASIEAALHVAWLAVTKKPVVWQSLARSALFSGIAVTLVTQLGKTKPVAEILAVPAEDKQSTQPSAKEGKWANSLQQSSPNCHISSPSRM